MRRDRDRRLGLGATAPMGDRARPPAGWRAVLRHRRPHPWPRLVKRPRATRVAPPRHPSRGTTRTPLVGHLRGSDTVGGVRRAVPGRRAGPRRGGDRGAVPGDRPRHGVPVRAWAAKHAGRDASVRCFVASEAKPEPPRCAGSWLNECVARRTCLKRAICPSRSSPRAVASGAHRRSAATSSGLCARPRPPTVRRSEESDHDPRLTLVVSPVRFWALASPLR